ncbi:MAG: hypothetical protein QM652_05425, partial [Legionella sp.]|uniref:hypothetical protein n=1 Tax=Legionella sp. TaxID=459 RepID=UPI0039E40288
IHVLTTIEFKSKSTCSKISQHLCYFFVNRELAVFAKVCPFPSPQPSPAKGIIILLKLLAREREQIEVKLKNM